MDSYSDYFLFPKCQTHAYTRFENACSENSTQKLLTKYSTEDKNEHVICRPSSVRIGKNCALGLEYGPRPQAEGRTQDRAHSFSQYGPPGRQITYIYIYIITQVILAFRLVLAYDLLEDRRTETYIHNPQTQTSCPCRQINYFCQFVFAMMTNRQFSN